ncbi:bifunctional diguanylate cyclase/phosphodiesterase [Azorhizobium doebereinerae]|uniref:bifunctional diguanylate cyclase/phosphodiesterase n=1 Tax=Azorhizobium doebereinerae TaxID=281091 RepID=UPI000426691B|nr:EAL domain-containing protein [Azorhizobium doebereinerae]
MLRSWLGSRDAASATIFARWTLPAIAILVAATYVVSAAILLHSAQQEDARSRARTEMLIRGVLAAEDVRLTRTLNAYANSGESYRNLHVAFDLEWTYLRDNLGPKIYHLIGIDQVYVVGPDDKVVYDLRNGRQRDPDADHLPIGVPAMFAEARSGSVHGLFWVEGKPALLGIAPVTPGADPTVQLTGGPQTLLVFIRFLGSDVLARISRQTALFDLRLVDSMASDPASPPMTLPTLNGPSVALSWTTPAPGYSVTLAVMPWLVACGGAFVLLTWLALAHASANARNIEQANRQMRVNREALLASEARFRDVAEAASDWIWEADPRLALTYLSERFEILTGRKAAELMGQPLDLVLNATDGPLTAWISQPAGRPLTPLICRYVTADGSMRLCRVAAKAVRTADGALAGFRGTATDITAEMEAHRQVEHLALYDPLTSLPNRALLMEFLAGALSGASEGKRMVATLRISLMNFKQVTDGYGLPAGDDLLVETAQRLRQNIHDNDLVARLGAEEFALVASAPSSVAAIEAMCARLRDAVTAPFTLAEAAHVHVGCAIGVALAPADAAEPERLLRCAELAMQHAQTEDPSGIAFFTADMNEQVRTKRTLEHDLRRTVGSEDFVLLYQPRYDTATLEVVAVEALVRWLHPRFGLLSPDQFIPLAETTGLIVPLGEWALRRACATIAKWPDLSVSVNVSPVQFHQGDQLVSAIESALKDSGLPPWRLELELTENVLIANTEKALEVLQKIKKLGVQLAMDDFGTGYSSLNYLRNFPFDRIKIDRRFVGDLDQSRDAQGIVEAILGLGRALGLAVTAEGVETAAQYAWLRNGRCDEVQGFHFARPQSEADLMQLKPRGSTRP